MDALISSLLFIVIMALIYWSLLSKHGPLLRHLAKQKERQRRKYRDYGDDETDDR